MPAASNAFSPATRRWLSLAPDRTMAARIACASGGTTWPGPPPTALPPSPSWDTSMVVDVVDPSAGTVVDDPSAGAVVEGGAVVVVIPGSVIDGGGVWALPRGARTPNT